MFHTQMHSIDGRFVLDENARREIYTKEKSKMDHLLDKFRRRLQQPGMICVYKRNSGTADNEAQRLQQSLNKSGQNTLLLVKSTDDQTRWSTVERSSLGFLVGLLDGFAPYFAADQVSIRVWNALLKNAYAYSNF
jgi:hypothetical protein